MTPLSLVCLVGLLAAPLQGSPAGNAPAAEPKAKTEATQAEPVVVPEKAPMAPEVKKAVDSMQRFYEDTKDFQADFKQTYKYKTFARTTQATGKMRFKKEGPSMRWDYATPDEKVFVIAVEKVFAYDKAAKTLTVSRLSADRLSASITFLWGQGKLDREFRIQKADRKDLKDGIALELTPKITDPRFQKIFFLLDTKTFSVKETVVVDPDGSENRMTFTNVKTNSGLSNDIFKIEPPEGTQIMRLDGP
ncbi:MAG: outer membrane lipoprotein carrier protein LolA [Deltaproteobacteria bacterium]|nr:outer membrane lipoprotein carrier protein LolA [Deltaproteobacteria bacterium]